MAQLPPKIPNNPTTLTSIQNPSWVDEFLDFSTSRRGKHRRSVSDSIAFVEACGRGDGGHGGSSSNNVAALLRQNEGEFDRFDDENFMSMLIDDVAPSKSNNSMSSDHNNSFNDRKEKISVDRNQQNARDVVESDEVQSQCETETQTAPSTTDNATVNDRIIDPKRVKRILANRQSAQRSRVRKLQYISELERSVTSLQAEVSVLSPRVAFLDQQRLLLTVDNSALKQRIAALAQDKIFKDGHQEALKRELERLRKVFQRQNMIKPENTTSSSPTQTVAAAGITASEKEQQLLLV